MMDAGERELFERGLRHAVTAGSGDAVDAALDELGWADALAVDPRTAVAGLFTAQGGANAVSSALDDVLAGALGVKVEGPAAVVLPPLGRADPPGAGPGLGTGALGRRSRTLVVAGEGGGYVARTVPTTDLTVRSVGGLDEALGLHDVTATAGTGETQPADWSAAVALGRLALGHELVGAARAVLGLARDHAVDRVQFGRPIASFQAVRHRLAESLVAIEGAEATLAAAWDAATPDGAVPSPQHAAMAKAAAGRSARLVTRHGQQVLAGIGFTTDHAFHRYLRRVLVLDQLLGSSREITRQLGEELIRARRLPAPLPL
jgi:alkylation response protein AidB-like acyl-CoA dehydrogenase